MAKVPALSGTAVGYAKDDKSIFLRDWEHYYHYSFGTNRWSKLKFGKKLIPLTMWSSGSLNFGYSKFIGDLRRIDFSPITKQIPLSFLPSFAKVLIISDQCAGPC